jgi:hypothetical protein
MRSTAALKSRRTVVLELPDELKSDSTTRNGGHKFLPPFVLGVAFASIWIFAPAVSGVYWLCKDVLVVQPLSCPRIVVKKTQPKKLRLFQKKQKDKNDDLLVEVPQPEDPLECSCRLVWRAWDRLRGKKEETTSSQQPFTCIPEIIEETSSLASSYRSSKPTPDQELKERFLPAFTPEKLGLTSEKKALMTRLAETTQDIEPNWQERASNVRWGGDTGPHWLAPKQLQGSTTQQQSLTDLESLEGGNLFYSYLRIMQWPETLNVHFPFKICPKGCNADVAIRHTLEFREKYKPWMLSPGAKVENSKGSCYFHGFSPSLTEDENGAHAVVWFRPGQRIKVDDVAYTRAYVNTLDRAVAASFQRSHGRVGKFNVVVDGSNFSWGLLPSLHQLKVFVTILQDHFPDRLGMVLLTNLGMVGELVVKLFLPLITEEVRNKIKVLPHGVVERNQVLETVVGRENVPVWLDGTDAYEFDVDVYYANDSMYASEEDANEYLTTMPYHA